MPKVPETAAPSALVTAIGGDAYAAGTNTDAHGVVNNTIKDMGNVTVAKGYATFEATGTSSADADTYLAVTGADIVVARHVEFGNTGSAWSGTRYVAIDIENWAPPNGPLVIDHHSAHQVESLPGHAPPSGNLATVVASADAYSADAHGANTATAALTDSLAVENQFSLVSGLAIVAA
jgi:hypothetical protein